MVLKAFPPFNNHPARLLLLLFLLMIIISNLMNMCSCSILARGQLDAFGHNEKQVNSSDAFIRYNYANKYGYVLRFDLSIPILPESVQDYYIHASIFDHNNHLLTTLEQSVESYQHDTYTPFPATSIVCPPKIPPGVATAEYESQLSVSIRGTAGLQYVLTFTQESALLYNPLLHKQAEKNKVAPAIVNRAKRNLDHLHKVDGTYIRTLWFDLTKEYVDSINSLDIKLYTKEDTANREIEGLFWIGLDGKKSGTATFCPDYEKVTTPNHETSRLTFKHGAVFNLNKDSRPPLRAGRYFIGVTANKEVIFEKNNILGIKPNPLSFLQRTVNVKSIETSQRFTTVKTPSPTLSTTTTNSAKTQKTRTHRRRRRGNVRRARSSAATTNTTNAHRIRRRVPTRRSRVNTNSTSTIRVRSRNTTSIDRFRSRRARSRRASNGRANTNSTSIRTTRTRRARTRRGSSNSTSTHTIRTRRVSPSKSSTRRTNINRNATRTNATTTINRAHTTIHNPAPATSAPQTATTTTTTTTIISNFSESSWNNRS